MPFTPLDPILHNQLRLAVVATLVKVERAEFSYLLDSTGATKGNLSAQITKLKEAGYVKVKKTFRKNYPLTTCSLTKKGALRFGQYVESIKNYLE